MTGPPISETSLTNEVKKANTLLQVERLALCPAQRGRRSDRPAASAAVERLFTTPRWSGYGRISVSFRFNSSSKRLWIPRASLPVKPLVKAVCPPCFPSRASRCSRLAPDSSHARNAVPIWTASAPRARTDYAARIRDATGGDHRHISDVGNLRDERECARQRIFRGSEERTAMATCLKARGDDGIDTGILKGCRLVRGCRGGMP